MTQTLALHWRQAVESDLAVINRIADSIHTGLPERPEVFAEKRRLYPSGCLVLEKMGVTVGYGISHPWLIGNIPSLDTFLHKLPAVPDCIYVHDVAILTEGRGHDAAGSYVQAMVDAAKKSRLDFLALVSVYDTHVVWARYGFKIVKDDSLVDKLASYGETAKYMVRDLR
jgi:hypothetical protein